MAAACGWCLCDACAAARTRASASCDARARCAARAGFAPGAGLHAAGSERAFGLASREPFSAADVAVRARRARPSQRMAEVGATMNNTVCPCGGFHEFEPVKGEQDFVAGIVAGACSTCLFCLWWPLLLCGTRLRAGCARCSARSRPPYPRARAAPPPALTAAKRPLPPRRAPLRPAGAACAWLGRGLTRARGVRARSAGVLLRRARNLKGRRGQAVHQVRAAGGPQGAPLPRLPGAVRRR
jgi:hypothetical protein